VPLLVCSSCHAPLSEGTTHCPRCGPGSLALLDAGENALVVPSGATAAELRLGRALGSSYRVVRLVGRGGFAEVYEVVDTPLQRRLAVKMLRSDLPWGPATLSRFKQEARAIARLNHPNIVPIHFVGEGEGLVFYAMPYLEGRTVAEILRAEGPLGVDRAVAIVEPVLDALQHAHQHGLVHRDVKPDNILIESGSARPLLVDFGIVKCLDGASHQTETGFVVGTPLYMSPEQALGQGGVDARADIYGVGAVLFQLLTGAPPFEGSTSQEIMNRHVREPVPVATLSQDRIPAWLSQIVIRCMAKHPDDRYPTARAALEAIRAGRTLTPAPAAAAAVVFADAPTESLPSLADSPSSSSPPPILTRSRRWPLLVGGGAAAAAIAGMMAIGPEPTLTVRNRLTEPVVLALDDTGTGGITIPPGDSVRLPLRRGRAVDARWAMVRPATLDGELLGDEIEGSIALEQPRRSVERVIDARTSGEARFAPLLVNLTRVPLRVAVVAGADSADCRCTVPPGDSIRLGYYRLVPGSAVRATGPHGEFARFIRLAVQTDTVSGLVRLRVEPALLHQPPGQLRSTLRGAPAARRPVRERRDPLRGIFPVR
jgi:serine/threonine protein kinase